MKFTLPFLFVALVLIPPFVEFADENLFKRENEIIYGRKHGMTMTIDVFQPLAKRLNWVGLIKRGYTLFAVVHGSLPKFTVPDIRQDMHPR